MGCSSSISNSTAATYSSKQAPHGRINVRLLMNPADAGDNRRPQQMLESISHIRDTPHLTLEQACQKLQIKDLSQCIQKAKISSRYPRTGLQQDEQAAINLYTQDTPFYQKLNEALRNNDQRTLTVWYNYLKLFFTALYKLPEYKGIVWRGVAKDLSATYRENSEHVWWSFSSCTSSVKVLKSPSFLGATGARTLFNIEVFDGRNVSEFSVFNEDEILLLPGTRLRVVSVLPQPPGLHIIHLKQVEPSHPLFDPSQLLLEKHHPPTYNQPHNDYANAVTDYEYAPIDDYYESPSLSTQDSESTFNTQIQLAKSINGDSEKAKVLKHLLSNKNLTDKMITGIADCVKTMYDADEKSAVLKLIAKRSSLSSQQFRVSVAAINSINGDSEKADTLKAFLIHEQYTVQHLDAVLSAAGTMYSGSDKALVFLQLIRNRYLNAKHFPSVLNGIKGINSDEEKSEVLCQLAPRLPKNDGEIRRAYLAAANSIYGAEEKAAATLAFAHDSIPKDGQHQKEFFGQPSNGG